MRTIDTFDTSSPREGARWRSSGRTSGALVRAMAALVCTVLVTMTVGVGASAAAGWPGRGGAGAHAVPSPAVTSLPHDIAPLTQANIVVTDLATNDSTVLSTASVEPDSGCAQDQTFVCFTLGSGAGFTLTVNSPLQAGQVYTDVEGTATVHANNASCGEFSTAGPASDFDVELDQYQPTPGQPVPYDSFGAQFDCTNPAYDISGTIAYNIAPTDPADGYYVFGQAGEIAGFGNDNYLTYLDGAQYTNLNAPIVGMVPTTDGAGYWMVGSDGGVFASGDAGFYGSTGSLTLNKPVVGMAATPDGKGYWFVASDGGIFAYGDAGFYGSMGGKPLNRPIVGMAATPDGKGYWLVASDGGVFSFGDAQFFGSTGSIHLNKPIVGMAVSPDGGGYWFVASDGGVFDYGSAAFAGSLGGTGVDDAAGISRGL
jgi:hypothetical protein